MSYIKGTKGSQLHGVASNYEMLLKITTLLGGGVVIFVPFLPPSCYICAFCSMVSTLSFSKLPFRFFVKLSYFTYTNVRYEINDIIINMCTYSIFLFIVEECLEQKIFSHIKSFGHFIGVLASSIIAVYNSA